MIGTLTSSSSSPSSSAKIVLEDFSAGIFRCRTEIFPSVPRKTFQFKLLRLDSPQKSRILKPIPLRSSSIEVSKVNLEAEEIQAIENSSTKTVRVRFQLRKECVFGEHFFILGDDSVFGGLWDPENALPMIWSDGNVWTIDLDLPVGRLVEFKFILKAKTGEFLWQPGPNRGIKTWQTNKVIRVCEDWENADLQMMIEEDFVPVKQEEQQYMPIVAENITQGLNTDVSSNLAEKEKEEVLSSTVQQKSFEVVVENEGYVSDESDQNLSYELSNGALTAREANVTKEAMFSEEEVPVLVPGLFPMSDIENEEESDEPIIKHVSVEVLNEGKAESFPEVDKKKQEETKGERNEKAKVKAISVFDDKLEREAVNGVVEQSHYNAAEEEIQKQLEKDIQWGRKTLYKLLSNFGLF